MWKQVSAQQLNTCDIFAFKNNDTNVVIKGRMINGSDNKLKVAVMSSDGAIQTLIDLPKWVTQSTSMLSQEAMFALTRLGYTDVNPDTIARLKQLLKDNGIIEEPICTILQYVPDLEIPDEAWDVE